MAAAARQALSVVVLAAGQGTRMRSRTIKLLHDVAGRPLVAWVMNAVSSLKPARTIAVIGHQADAMRQALEGSCHAFVLQKEQRGTGHALMQAAGAVTRSRASTLLVLNGDLPTLKPSTLRELLSQHRRSGAALTIVTAELDRPQGYGRIVRAQGRVLRIVEEVAASSEERKIREVNCGIYCAKPPLLLSTLKRLRSDNPKGEYFLTDAVQELVQRGERVETFVHEDAADVLGVNTRAELARAALALYARKASELQDQGVTLLDPARIWIDPRARVGRDSIIYPDVIVEGKTTLGADCIVRPGCRLVDCRIGPGVEIRDHSLLVESEVGPRAKVGPFAHLRPGSVLGAGARVGNFVELKQTSLGARSKASHLSYLGDARIGADCNIGAGTITCNYDGGRKHPTTLGRRVFVGSDTQLVAPVTVRDGAYVAAGTTVTHDVPAGALAIGRSRQRNVAGWVARKRKQHGGNRHSA